MRLMGVGPKCVAPRKGDVLSGDTSYTARQAANVHFYPWRFGADVSQALGVS